MHSDMSHNEARITSETENDIITYGKRTYVKFNMMKCIDVEVLLDLAQLVTGSTTAKLLAAAGTYRLVAVRICTLAHRHPQL